jgi:nucleotide-binding universal stress UspA family protein
MAIEEKDPTAAIETAKELARQLSAQIHLVHVADRDESAQQNTATTTETGGFPFHIIRDENLVQALSGWLPAHNIDLLVLFPHRHTLLDRIFSKPHTTEVLGKITIPVMCIPS